MASDSSNHKPEDPDSTPAHKESKKIKEGEYIEKAMTNMMSVLAGNERAAEERLLKEEEEHKGKSQHMKKG